MNNDTLYEKDQIKITSLHSPEPGREEEIISTEDHELWIRDKNNEWSRYVIQRGILRELAETSERNPSGLANLLDKVNPSMLCAMQMEKISLEDISAAIMEAYKNETDKFKRYRAEHPIS